MTPHLLAVLGLSTFASAQIALPVFPTLPHAQTNDMLVTDQSFDGVWRLIDWNQDGDFDDAGEAIAYYDESIGSIAISTPGGIAVLRDGTALVADLGEETIVAMRDGNGDGDAHDAGEHRVFFDVSNASGVQLFSMNALCVDILDRVFVTNANNGQGGYDGVFVLEDLNGDGDAQDVGEAREYCAIPNAGASTSHSNPFDVVVGPDLNLYYVDGGTNGPIIKGVYKLADLNFDGDCNDPGEWSLFWQPQSVGSSPFFTSFAIDQQGWFYLGDHGADDVIWRARDLDGNGSIDPSEESIFYDSGPTNSIWWDMSVRDDGSIALLEDAAPRRVLVLTDGNADGDALDPGEVVEAYSSAVSPNPNVRGRAMTYVRAPVLTVTSLLKPGQTGVFKARTEKPLELAAFFISNTTPPFTFPLPPWGTVEIDALNFASIGFGLSDAVSCVAIGFQVPNVPAAVGTWRVQALCGDDFRLYLTNGATVTVTP